jgi:hypothetical protein
MRGSLIKKLTKKEDCEFEANLGCIAELHSDNSPQKKKVGGEGGREGKEVES